MSAAAEVTSATNASASSSSEKLPEFEPPLASINRLIKAVSETF